MFQNVSTLVNQRLHFDTFLPTSSRIFKVSIFQLRHSPFFTLFEGLPRSHRLSSHSRLNAFVIQTKLSQASRFLPLPYPACPSVYDIPNNNHNRYMFYIRSLAVARFD